MDNIHNLAPSDINVTVDQPQINNAFFNISLCFRVITKTTRNDFDKEEYIIQRQYDDFLSLRDGLLQKYSCTILPPLQDYNNLILLKSFEEIPTSPWMKQRICSFNHFLNTLAHHDIISKDPIFKNFLTQIDFRLTPGPQNASLSVLGRLARRFTRLVQENATTLVLKARSAEFQSYLDYGRAFNAVCQRLERLNDHLSSEFTGYGGMLEAYITFQDDWAILEPQNGDLIKGEALCNARLNAVLMQWLPNFKSSNYFIKNYALYLDAMKDAMQSRDECQVEYELTRDEYVRRQREIAQKLGKPRGWGSYIVSKFLSPKSSNLNTCPEVEPSGGKNDTESSIVKDFRAVRSQLQMESLEVELESNKIASMQADSEFRQDFGRWHSYMVRDFREYFYDLATLYVDLYTQNLEVLNETIEQIPGINIQCEENALPTIIG